jgi:hypothetical protein
MSCVINIACELFKRPKPRCELHATRSRRRRDQHPHGLRQVWRYPPQYRAFARRLAHEADVPLGQVSYAAMNQLRGAAARSRGEITAIEEYDGQAAERCLARHARARYAAADN